MTIRDPERERQILQQIRTFNVGPLGNEQLARIYRALFGNRETYSVNLEVWIWNHTPEIVKES